MSIFTDRSGTQRWSCWATGRSGTAIDLVATVLRLDVGGAIDWLAARHGSELLPAVVTPRRSSTPPRTAPSEALRRYVAACQERLWRPEGADARNWLSRKRRLADGILEENAVGFDPGPSRLQRARGLPWRGPGVVLPTFDDHGALVYAQLRYFDVDHAGRKYDNPSSHHATKPALSWPRPHGPLSTTAPLVLCEGTLDAMTVTAAGVRSVALIAAGDAHHALRAVEAIDGPIVIAVDNDPAGRGAAATLLERLHAAGHPATHLTVPGDINELAQRTGERFPAVLRAALRGTRASWTLTAVHREP